MVLPGLASAPPPLSAARAGGVAPDRTRLRRACGGADPRPAGALDTGEDPPTPPGVGRSIKRWVLSDTARRVLRSAKVRTSISACGLAGHHTGAVQIRRCEAADGGDRLAVDGALWCGSARCPRCGPIVAGKVGDRVSEVLEAAREKGLGVALLTLTVAHDRATSLLQAREDMADAWRRLPDGGLGRRLKVAGLVGSVRVWEATAGERTGWHLHAHALVLHERGAEAAVAAGEAMAGRWLTLMGARGWRAVRAAQDVRPVVVGDGLPDYGTKSLRGWGPAAELAAQWAKEGRRPDRVSLPELLGLAAAGDRWAASKYVEAVQALRGQRLFCVGPALKKRLGLTGDDVQAEGEAVEVEERPGEVVAQVPASTWTRAANKGLRAWVLDQVWQRVVLWGEDWATVLPDLVRGVGPPSG